METVKKLWDEYLGLTYPSDIHQRHSDLEIIESTIAGCISSFIATDGKLDAERIKILKKYLVLLESQTNEMPDSAKSYFARLHTLGTLVLKHS
jgi:hypothetical protein